MLMRLVRQILWAAFVLLVFIPVLVNGMIRADTQMLRQIDARYQSAPQRPAVATPPPHQAGPPPPIVLYRY